MNTGTANSPSVNDSQTLPETRIRLDVSGMDCGDCAKTIEASLGTMPGVRTASVNFPRGSADVVVDPSQVTAEALRERIRNLGYGAQATASAGASDPWVFDVGGMDCGDCARTIETGVQRLASIASAKINFGAGTLTVVPADDRLTRDAIVSAIERAGYQATPRPEHGPEHALRNAAPPWWRQRRVIETALAGLFWLVGFGLERAGAARVWSAIPFLAAMLVAGYPVARAGWYAVRARRADMNLLMTVAAVGAILIGRWDEGSSVLILFAIGLTLQTLTIERTRRAIQALVKLMPQEAIVRRDGTERVVPVGEVAVGEIVIVRPGDRIPVDGIVVAGRSAVDQASITGESIPVEVQPESGVFAGSVNGDGAVEVRSTKPASDTTLSQIIHLVEEAQSSKAPAQAFVDRFAAVYTPIVIVVALLIATVVPLFVGDFRDWVFKALVLLVIACPCALVISTPVALVASIGSASRRGVLFKGGAAIEALAHVRAVAFDKTGTLTAGRPAVTKIESFGAISPDQLLARAAAVESRSTHPIAQAVMRAAADRGLQVPAVVDAEGIPGRGARARLGTDVVTVGSQKLFAALPDEAASTLQSWEEEGRTAVVVGTAAGVEGIIAVADTLRPAGPGAVAALQRLGIATVMLTGDNRYTAARIAEQVGVSDVRAELLPADKVTAIRELQQTTPVAMVGDGVNDAPAMATATVGIAMGVAGTDVALETADVALMGDELAQLPPAVQLARKTLTIIRQNITVSLLVKAVFLVLTFVGVTNLWLAVLADTGMSLVVTFNSLRLLRVSSIPAQPTGPHPRPSEAVIPQLVAGD